MIACRTPVVAGRSSHSCVAYPSDSSVKIQDKSDKFSGFETPLSEASFFGQDRTTKVDVLKGQVKVFLFAVS